MLTSFSTIGPYELDWNAGQYKCWIAQYITFGLLAILQSINIFWLFFILRIAWNVVFKHEEKDVRSDDEDDEVEEGGEKEKRKIGPVPGKMNGKVNGSANEGSAKEGFAAEKKEQ